MMSAGSTLFQAAENGNGGKQRTPCPLHGCKRVYTDKKSLDDHVKDHEIHAECLPGKLMLCSTIGCNGSFPDMQKLMEHMRHHHKPNIYFLCENCRTKLRSYKGLLTHLHTCSKVPRGKPKQPEPTLPTPAPTNPNMPPMAMDQDPPRLESMSTSQQLPPHIQHTDGSLPAAAPQPESVAPPHLGPPFLPGPDPSPPQLVPQQLLAELTPLPQLKKETSEVPPSLNLEGDTKVSDPPDVKEQHQAQRGSIETSHPAPQSPPSSAVWKKSQALTSSRRVLWEHTRGRYTCVQCGLVTTNRKEMTLHISTYHGVNKPAGDTENSAAMS